MVVMEGMARRLRVQYPDAIYHIMARGNGRQDIVCDDMDRSRLQEDLGKAALRCCWRIYAFAIMSNHLHIVLKLSGLRSSRPASRVGRLRRSAGVVDWCVWRFGPGASL